MPSEGWIPGATIWSTCCCMRRSPVSSQTSLRSSLGTDTGPSWLAWCSPLIPSTRRQWQESWAGLTWGPVSSSSSPCLLHETLFYKRLLGQDLGLVPGDGNVRRMQHVMEGARSHGPGSFRRLWCLCLSQTENETDLTHHLQSKWLLGMSIGLLSSLPAWSLFPI